MKNINIQPLYAQETKAHLFSQAFQIWNPYHRNKEMSQIKNILSRSVQKKNIFDELQTKKTYLTK